MNSRWSDAEAQGKSDLDLLVYASRLIGAETTLVVWGGGNTSIKREERDYRGRPTRVLRVKGGSPALRILRHYYDRHGDIPQVSLGYYPEGRFTYTTRMRMSLGA